jgi:pimeloyl-ACP methyl ester carboxylesterase
MSRDLHVDVRGMRLHARAFGGPKGTPALLLHGWLDHCGSFDLLGPLLAEEGPAWALDFRGHGDSQWVPPGAFYHVVEYAADVDGALDALGIEGPVRLVGHSLGGAVALLYAAARPARVQHATLLDALPLTAAPDQVPDRLSSWLDDLKAPRARRLVRSAEDAAERLLRFNPQLAPEAARHLARGAISPDPAQNGALAWKWDPLLRGHSPLPLTPLVLQALTAKVQAPLLLLRGGDGFVPDASVVRERLPALQRLTVETLEGVSHHLHLEQPAEVAARVLREWRKLGS